MFWIFSLIYDEYFHREKVNVGGWGIISIINLQTFNYNVYLHSYFIYVSTSLFQYNFNDLSGSVSLAWVGDDTGVSRIWLIIYIGIQYHE